MPVGVLVDIECNYYIIIYVVCIYILGINGELYILFVVYRNWLKCLNTVLVEMP